VNHARKLIAFVLRSSERMREILCLAEPTTGDLSGVLQMLTTARGDLEELEQRIKAEIERRRQRPAILVPPRDAIVDREYATDAQRARVASCVGPDLGRGHEHQVLASFANIETPDRALPNRRPHLAPGRYTWDHHARRLLAAGGTLQLTRKPV
jgi:hypothetical protein